ncbi:hypothetical protein BpHYR1_025998 [Brachionus plicatilis]|uniref:Uncharacterized protein n=1 Tax=Brachionus plicatilis TaxID=10195 RepID=A0A3M7PR94_BRAPC|nr:hypothetical protein BpHYR1_025998 [Brachionus plicatilis]
MRLVYCEIQIFKLSEKCATNCVEKFQISKPNLRKIFFEYFFKLIKINLIFVKYLEKRIFFCNGISDDFNF